MESNPCQFVGDSSLKYLMHNLVSLDYTSVMKESDAHQGAVSNIKQDLVAKTDPKCGNEQNCSKSVVFSIP
jgi:hypothetical protein